MAEATPVEDAALAVRRALQTPKPAAQLGPKARERQFAGRPRFAAPRRRRSAAQRRCSALRRCPAATLTCFCPAQAFMAAVQQAGTPPASQAEADENASVFSAAPSASGSVASEVSNVPSMTSYATSVAGSTATAAWGAQPPASSAYQEPVTRSTATFKPPVEGLAAAPKPAPPLEQFQIPVTSYQPSTAPSISGSYVPSYAPSYAQSYAPSAVDTEVRAARAARPAPPRAGHPEPQKSAQFHCALRPAPRNAPRLTRAAPAAAHAGCAQHGRPTRPVPASG